MNSEQVAQLEPMAAFDARRQARPNRLSAWAACHPVLAILLVSAIAVMINCYPIIFCGRSFVSPTRLCPMLHDGIPTFPGMQFSAGYEHGSDTAAPLVWSVPAGFIASRAILDHGEIPLWNRYSHGGDTFIGQAISMLGDPLQLIVILGRGSSIAWDIKYLLAKFLFCAGFGLVVLRLIGSRPLSLVFSVLAAYCGTYFYIYIHPAFFLFSYAPWILLSTIEFLDTRSERYYWWGLAWLGANVGCFNGGHIEPAVILIGGLNLVGLAFSVAQSARTGGLVAIIFRMAVATLLFLGLTAPVWLSFLVAMQGAYSDHMSVAVDQITAGGLLGAFDDVFMRLLMREDSMPTPTTPGTSLLIAVGALFATLQWRRLKQEPFFWINSAAIILWTGTIFKIIPASLFEAIPLLNRVGHIYVDFSYLLAISLTIQCAYGFKCLAEEKSVAHTARILAVVLLIIEALTALYCFTVIHAPIPWNYFLCVSIAALAAPLLYVYLKNSSERKSPLLWAGVVVLGFIPNIRFGLYHTGNEAFLLKPGPRIVLNQRSEAIDRIKADSAEPFRVVGMQRNLFGDYAAVYELEDIRSCAPLTNPEFMALLRTFPGMKVSAVWIAKVLDPVAARPLLNMLNVKYLLSSPLIKDTPGRGAFPVASRSDFVVLKNTEVWPRAFFTDKVISIPTSEEFVHHLVENGKEPFAALTPDEIRKESGLAALQSGTNNTVVTASHYQLRPNSTGFDVTAASAGLVCLTEGQGKDFIATANGARKAVLTVNRAFKGIYLDKPGNYHIEFTFRPRHWRLACVLFWTAAALVPVLLVGQYIAGRRANRRINRFLERVADRETVGESLAV